VPVLVRYGLTDVLVPPAHGEWLAENVPDCTVRVDGGTGHLGGDQAAEIAQNLRWLLSGAS
jgi:pimeloyl-ACP methyl ester carboxylesterase